MMTQQQKDARFLQYEEILKEESKLLQRIQKTMELASPSDAARLYLYVLIPMLTGFVQWTLEEALRTGKKRLYFLSRDGYQMYLLGKKLNEDGNFGIECKYLNVSRYSMRIPEYHLSLDRAIDQMCINGIDVSLTKILQRAALTQPQIDEVLEETDLKEDASKILTYREIIALKNTLKSSKRLMEYIMEYSSAAFDTTISYLEQEGLLDGVPFALVDSGWVGTLQMSIENLLRTADPEIRVEGYYFGMYEYPGKVDRTKFHTYYFSPTKGVRRKVDYVNSLFETIVSADEGMTKSYEYRKDEGYFPVKDVSGNPNREQMLDNIRILEMFLEQEGHLSYDQKKLQKITEKVVKLFMAFPTELELETYGDDLFSDDIIDENRLKVAAELTDEEIRNLRFWNKLFIVLKIKKGTIRGSSWLEGSIVRNGGNIKSNLRHARFYKYILYTRKQILFLRK
ncbi:MAG: hypothetical protein IKF90_02785 [Parasporobacterium sp.]|nr:hypothetical protein [Parasporobacterium sp.]